MYNTVVELDEDVLFALDYFYIHLVGFKKN